MCFFVEINLTRDELNKRFSLPVPKDPRYMPGYFHAAFTKPYIPVITSLNPEIIGLNKNLNINDKSIIEKVNYPYDQYLF